MPRQFSGGTDQLSWPPHPGINATKPRPITLVGWATGWNSNSINDRFLINKADANHQKGEFSVFEGTFDSTIPTNRTFALWHNPWDVSNSRWDWLAPSDDGWHMWSVRYDPVSTIEIPEMEFDLVPAQYLPEVSNQPSGHYLAEAPPGSGFNDPTFGNTNPVPFNLDLGNTAGSGFTSWDGAFWRFAWWDAYLTKNELQALYCGKPPNLIRFKNLLFYAELDDGGLEADRGFNNMGYASVTGTKKSLDAPVVRTTPLFGSVGLRRVLREKGSSPTGNVTLAGQGVVMGQGTLLPATNTKPLVGRSVTTAPGSVLASVRVPLTGQQLTSGQGSAGPITAPKQINLPGQAMASAAGALIEEVAVSLAGQGAATIQGDVNSGFKSTINLPGLSTSIGQGALMVGPAPAIATAGLLSIQGQLYIDSEVEYVQQNWTKVEGPP